MNPSSSEKWARSLIHEFGPDAIIRLCLKAGRIKVLAVTAALMTSIAIVDWSVGNTFSLGVLYILPMMLGAVVLSRLETFVLAIVCAILKALFDTPGSHAEISLRFAFASLAYFSSALFVTALVRNRRMVVEHLNQVQREQALRRDAEEQLSVLVESSPAAILTVDEDGTVLAANKADQQH